jgi:hypothetical protein
MRLGSARLAAARIAGNAARAVAAGLGRANAVVPPPLFAFDPDTGRLAVTTPADNTAIVPVNQRAFPYGGIELAQLFDAHQEVAAGPAAGRVPTPAQQAGRLRGRAAAPCRRDGADADGAAAVAGT